MATARLRPQMMRLTDAAANRIKSVMANAGRPIVGVRVGVKNGGCAGMAYTMEYAETVPLPVIPNPMGMAFRKVDAVNRDADREARRASSSISTLPQMGWSKVSRLDLAQIGKMLKS